MSKPKILFEAGPMMDIKKTGVGYYVDYLVRNLGRDHGDTLELVGYYFDFLNRNHKQAPEISGVRFKKISLIPGKLLSLTRRFKFQPPLGMFTREPADIVLFTNYVSLPVSSHKKVAVVIYDLGFLDHPEYTQSVNLAYMQTFCPPSIKRADIIVTISEFTKQRLLHYFPDLTANIIVTPIPPVPVDTTVNTAFSVNLTTKGIKPKQYILFVSTLEPRKNVQNLVKAYAQLPPEIRNEYALVLVGGKGWKDEEIQQEIATQQAAGMNVIPTGYVTDQEKAALYANASCYVLPSHYEGFGMTPLEAMQWDIPVALSDIPVFREVAEDAAVYFDKDDPENIAATIASLIQDTDLQQKLISAGHRVLTRDTWTNNSHLVYEAFTNNT